MYFKGQKFFVAGMSVSGESSARFLLERGAEVYIYDDVISDAVSAIMNDLKELGAHVVSADSLDSAVQKCDILVISPGIPIDTALPIAFRKQGKPIIGEEELAAMFLRATSVAVTGTNGKTTTVTMLGEMLNKTGNKCVACGNNGNPLIREVEDLTFNDFAVLEISSFQLETLSSLRPHIAVITNISEDHLNRHYNMENYVFLKSKILRNLRESEFAVLNYDDPTVRGFAANTKAKVVYFSIQSKVDGAYYENGSLYFRGEKFFEVNDLTISGVHNVYNALACVAVAGILKLDKKKAGDAICAFKGVRHRIEKIREVNGVTYIDDSKGTNVDATLKAVQSMKVPTVLMLGGKDKGDDYSPLFEGLNSSTVVHAVIYGENRFKMLNAAIKSGFTSFSLCSEFKRRSVWRNLLQNPVRRFCSAPPAQVLTDFPITKNAGKRLRSLSKR